MPQQPNILFWFRRDLRLHDNHALYNALESGFPVQPVFIYDEEILRGLERDDARVWFIRGRLAAIHGELQQHGSSLQVFHGNPAEIFAHLMAKGELRGVYANEDYEPYALERDRAVAKVLDGASDGLRLFSDHLIMPPGTVLKDDGTPYTVYTPFMKRWKLRFGAGPPRHFPSETLLHRTAREDNPVTVPDPHGFTPAHITVPSPRLEPGLLVEYAETRDRPDLDATSRLGPHLRFGTVSVREAVREALAYSETFLNELIWREFFAHILFHFPHVTEKSFKRGFDLFPWQNEEADIERWMTGTTGFPIVDAGMRQLVQTGLMHNRVRMITASFLVKDLLVDWRIGEAFFARHLLDYELASNNGNWQWAAGTGCDAAPFFRIFNPTAQQRKFDPHQAYIRKWVPEFGTARYPEPMIDHAMARERALAARAGSG
jgi:deoxyribodipyrimidine photo-lyase